MTKGVVRRKLVIVGDGNCGKTSLLSVFAKGDIPYSFIPTVMEEYTVEVTIDGQKVELQLFDTAGQEELERIRPYAYPYSDVVLICFSIDRPDLLENVEEKWVPEVLHFCSDPIVPIILVGCKKDLHMDASRIEKLALYKQTPITEEQGKAFAERMGVKMYVECSALKKEGVSEVFESATRMELLPKVRKKKERKFRMG